MQFRWIIMALMMLGAFDLCLAQGDKTSQAGNQVQLIEPGWAGSGRYRSGKWGLVRTGVRNVTDQEVELYTKIWFHDDPDVQFTSPVWAPAGARMEIQQPVRIPRRKGRGKSIRMSGQLVDRDAGSEKSKTDYLEGSGGFEARGGFWINCMLRDASDDAAVEMVQTLRASQKLTERFSVVNRRNAPRVKLGWDAIDCLVVSQEAPQLERAQTEAIRQWVVGGGILWVMLDQVDPRFLESVLLDSWNGHLVERVSAARISLSGPETSVDLEFDNAVTLARVLAPDMQVMQEVNGWPATLIKPVGQGWLVITTLDPKAWVSQEQNPKRPQWVRGKLQAVAPLKELGDWFIAHRQSPRVIDRRYDAFEPLVRAQVGYEILGRGVVMALLIGFCVAMIVVGLLLGRKNRLEQLVWVGPGMAVVVALILIGLGEMKGRAVPLTVAIGQHVQVAPGGRTAMVSGLAGIYSPQGGQGRLESSVAGQSWPKMDGQGGQLREMYFHDLGRWQWRQHLKPGINLAARNLRLIQFEAPVILNKTAVAVMTFDAQGVKAQIQPGPFDAMEDRILIGPSGALSLRELQPGNYEAGPDDVLDGPSGLSLDLADMDLARRVGQYIDSNTLTDMQQAHQQVYRSLLDPPDVTYEPTVMGWVAPMDIGISWPEGAQQRGSALVSIPLRIDRPKAKTRVTIPSPFMRFTWIPPDGENGVPSYHLNIERRGWVPVGRDGRVVVRFDPPTALLPLRLESAKVHLNMEALGRSVKLYYRTDSQAPQMIAELKNPTGSKSLAFDLPDQPVLVRGGLWLELLIESPGGLEAMPMWRIDRIDLQLQGTILEARHSQP